MSIQNFKDRLYNHEATPPAEIWDHISEQLDNDKYLHSIPAIGRRPKLIFYGLTAAAALIIIFISSVVFNRAGENKSIQNIKPASIVSSTKPGNAIPQKVKDSLFLNNKTLEAIIKSSKNKNAVVKNSPGPEIKVKKYITIEGPECQPVKISSKVATLIESADNEYPPKAVWNKKIDKWKQIMLSTTLSPTSTSFLDIAQLSSSLDNNE